MQVNNTPPAQTPAQSQAAGSGKTVNYDQFLQLLIAQIKNQDPTNPTDSTQFVSQLASFSSVEQQVNTNSKLDNLLTSSALAQANAVIGRTITSADGKISGPVASVEIVSGAARATLDDGQTITLGSGVKIS